MMPIVPGSTELQERENPRTRRYEAMMIEKKSMSRRNGGNIVSVFLSGLRKNAARRANSGLDFYTRSAMPALLSMQLDLCSEKR